MTPRLSVSLGLWQDRPAEEALETARLVASHGFDELWVGEMATYDAFALATAIGAASRRLAITIGPLAVTVRDPVMIALGAASVAALTGCRVGVALGTSSNVVVEDWHGRSRARPAVALAESAEAVRTLLEGGRADVAGQVVRTNGYRLRLPPPRGSLTVAAFGPAAVRIAAQQADRMVINLVSAETAASLAARLEECANEAGRPKPPLAAWVPAAVDPRPAAMDQLRRAIVGYLAAPGYAEMFTRAGFGEVVAYARTRPHPRDLFAAVPAEIVSAIGIVGDEATARERLVEYASAGVDEVVIVPAATADDPAGRRTIETVARLWATMSQPATA